MVKKEEKVNKRDQAFELFRRGERIGSLKLEDLNLKSSVLDSFFKDWVKLKAEGKVEKYVPPKPKVQHKPKAILLETEEIAPTSAIPFVTVSSLSVGAEFNLDGNLYRIRQNRKCAFLELSGETKIEKYAVNIPADTLVLPT